MWCRIRANVRSKEADTLYTINIIQKEATFVELIEDLLTAICENLFWAIAFESELYQLLALLSRHEIDAAIIVKGRFSK